MYVLIYNISYFFFFGHVFKGKMIKSFLYKKKYLDKKKFWQKPCFACPKKYSDGLTKGII